MRLQRHGKLALLLALALVFCWLLLYFVSSFGTKEDPDETRIILAPPIWEKRKLQQPDDQFYKEKEDNEYVPQGDGTSVLKLPDHGGMMTVIDDWEREQLHGHRPVVRNKQDVFGADDKKFVSQKMLTNQESDAGDSKTNKDAENINNRFDKIAKEMKILLSDFDVKNQDSSQKENSVVVQETSSSKGTVPQSPQYVDKIAILTPIANAENRLDRYANLIRSLSYPHSLISVMFGEDSSGDGTLEKVKVVVERLKHEFRRVQFFHFNDNFYIKQDWSEIHRKSIQLKRRSHLAKSRNNLIFEGLRDEDWALWIDSDVTSFPSDLIQKLLAAKKDVVVPSCMSMDEKGDVHLYDRNTWRETKSSLALQKVQSPDYLMLEGYDQSERLFLPDLKSEGDVVKIDGVGGCVLLIKAIHHKQGLIFPPFIFDHHIETEGLAKMAKAMNISLWGMPNLEVYH